VLLDKGQEDDWFGSHFITTLIVTATVCLIALVIWEWFQKTPIIDVRMFKSFNFASANLMMFMLGILLFSALVLMPQFLQTLMVTPLSWRGLRFRREALSADGDAHRGQADDEGAGAIPDRAWLVFAVHCDVFIRRNGSIC